MTDTIPILWPIQARRYWPKGPNVHHHLYAYDASVTAWLLFDRYFGLGRILAPPVYWSSRLGPNADAVTYHWGICLSHKAYTRVAKARRACWLTNVLKHELVHWAGYERHDATFKTYLKRIGGTV